MSNYYSWRPNVDFDGAPIPTRFDYEDNRIHILLDRTKNSIVYYGFRAQDSLNLHEFLSTKSNYPFQFPSRSVYMLIEYMRQTYNPKQDKQRIVGMTEEHRDDNYIFDSCFESGNLDMAVKLSEKEYDLYMRSDSNTKGHHQWFYFSVEAKTPGTVRFNIVNFTKKNSLYTQGMRVAIFSEQKAEKANKGELPKYYANWFKGGDNISYKLSKLTQELYQKTKIM